MSVANPATFRASHHIQSSRPAIRWKTVRSWRDTFLGASRTRGLRCNDPMVIHNYIYPTRSAPRRQLTRLQSLSRVSRQLLQSNLVTPSRFHDAFFPAAYRTFFLGPSDEGGPGPSKVPRVGSPRLGRHPRVSRRMRSLAGRHLQDLHRPPATSSQKPRRIITTHAAGWCTMIGCLP